MHPAGTSQGNEPMDDDKSPKLAEELAKMQHEPLLPVEKKLIAYSLLLGVVLLALLWWVSATFFGGH
jgi:hypothetical protein